MSLLDRLLHPMATRGRRSLRRVSPERIKVGARAGRRVPVNQAGEKLVIAVLFGLASVVLVGLGADLTPAGWVGLGALVMVSEGFFIAYAVDFRREALASLSKVGALAVFMTLPIIALHVLRSLAGIEGVVWLPMALFALPMALVWGRAFALECTLYTGGLLGIAVILRPGSGGAEAIAICMAGALVACLSAGGVRRRSSLVRVGLSIGLVQVLVACAFLLLAVGEGNVVGDWRHFLLLGVGGLGVGLVTSGVLPAVEALFGVTTDISLLELGNTHEQPLLRKLLLEAPGTFHHSYIVGLISEASAEAVGGNALLARVGALYHDVGKLNKPGYFAENSPEARGRHKDLTPEMSMLVISAHTRDGVEIGSYYGLPPQVLAFMEEHHGTCCIEYFYHRARDLRGEDKVSEDDFRYPGRRPQSVEPAIVMIADAVEAISRQMPEPTPVRLTEMVHEVAMKRLMDGQFDECGMTLKDLSAIEEACVRVLSGIYHTRPTFPKGRPHPLDLSQPKQQRRGEAAAEDQASSAGRRSSAS
ncbi:MAG: HDIG domain-containing protein [Planctomycetota bacterium]|nr:HDIG domain-containing protein [Planctomycetota bacterium]